MASNLGYRGVQIAHVVPISLGSINAQIQFIHCVILKDIDIECAYRLKVDAQNMGYADSIFNKVQ